MVLQHHGKQVGCACGRAGQQYDIVIVDQVSVVIPLLHALTRAKVRPPACRLLWGA